MSNEQDIDPRVLAAIADCQAYCMDRAPDAGYEFELMSILGQGGNMHPTLQLSWWQELEQLIREDRDTAKHARARAQFDEITNTVASVGADKSWVIVDNMVKASRLFRAESELAAKKAAHKKQGTKGPFHVRFKEFRKAGYRFWDRVIAGGGRPTFEDFWNSQERRDFERHHNHEVADEKDINRLTKRKAREGWPTIRKKYKK